jgi:hypothetical protein
MWTMTFCLGLTYYLGIELLLRLCHSKSTIPTPPRLISRLRLYTILYLDTNELRHPTATVTAAAAVKVVTVTGAVYQKHVYRATCAASCPAANIPRLSSRHLVISSSAISHVSFRIPGSQAKGHRLTGWAGRRHCSSAIHPHSASQSRTCATKSPPRTRP